VLLHSFPDRFTHEFFIRSANPDRRLVEAVYRALSAAAAADGAVSIDTARIATRLAITATPRDVESAVRVLIAARALYDERRAGNLARVRLLATPDRIRAELGADGEERMELGLLRALWRMAGDRLHAGATIDLEALPPGFGRAAGARRILDALQSRQFLTWEPEVPCTRLDDPRRPLESFRIDWARMDRRRTAEMAKLDAMQLYAYLKGCRRDYVLRYFGDPAARRGCTGCDNCLGIRIKPPAVRGKFTRGKGKARRRR
jgi:ATP-dependent DNA helicase RecQ